MKSCNPEVYKYLLSTMKNFAKSSAGSTTVLPTNDLEDCFPQLLTVRIQFSATYFCVIFWISRTRFFFARKWNIAAIISNLRNVVITQDQTKCKGLQLTLLLIVFALPNCTCLRLSAERCILHRIIHQTKPKHRSETAVYNSWWVPLFFYWKLLGP